MKGIKINKEAVEVAATTATSAQIIQICMHIAKHFKVSRCEYRIRYSNLVIADFDTSLSLKSSLQEWLESQTT